jgi:hypothetical protein
MDNRKSVRVIWLLKALHRSRYEQSKRASAKWQKSPGNYFVLSVAKIKKSPRITGGFINTWASQEKRN